MMHAIILKYVLTGFTCAECSQIYVTGLIGHVKNLFNLLDFMVLSTYSGAFTLTYFTMIKVSNHLYTPPLSCHDELDQWFCY